MTKFFSRYSTDFNDPDNCAESYGVDDIRFLSKSHEAEGFDVHDIDYVPDNADSYPRFVDSSRKIVIDNSVFYGHFIPSWLYVLVKAINSNEAMTVLFFESPGSTFLNINHMTSVTEYLKKELTKRGHRVEYINNHKFYINNFIHIKTPFGFQLHTLKPVSDFFVENISPGVKIATEKIYLSRGKVASNPGFNGNANLLHNRDIEQLDKEKLRQHREDHKYKLSARIDDEQALEEYLKTLGFIIMYPEDFDSYHDQMDKIASARILMSMTSSSLSACLVLAPDTIVIELGSPMFTGWMPDGITMDTSSSEYHDYYKVMSLVRNNIYMSISNIDRKTANIINSIENNESLKTILAS